MIAFAMKSVTSAKEYLFVNSVGQGCEPHDNGVGAGEEDVTEENNYNNAGSTLDTNSLETAGTQRKPSHRQRKRSTNFFVSIPRTPPSL